MKFKAALLLCLMAAAVLSVGGAWRSLHRTGTPVLPDEIDARFAGREESAAYFLRDDEGRVAVYEGRRGREQQGDGQGKQSVSVHGCGRFSQR